MEIFNFLRFTVFSQNKMAVEGKLNFKSAKTALNVTNSALTKASSEFENSCKDIQKNAEAVHIKKKLGWQLQ